MIKMSETLLWKAGAKLVRKPACNCVSMRDAEVKGGPSSGPASVSARVTPGQLAGRSP